MVAKRALPRTHPTSVRLVPPDIERLDILVARWHISRSHVISRLLDREFSRAEHPSAAIRDPEPDHAVAAPAHIRRAAIAAAERAQADRTAMTRESSGIKPCKHNPRRDQSGDLRCSSCGILLG